MSRQRNDPDDPSAKLAEYDFTKSDGSSPDDEGKVETDGWPDGVDKDEFRDSGKEIVPMWVRSKYKEPSKENLRRFIAEQDERSGPTIRINVLKAYQHQLRKSHLTNAERLSIAILAYEQSSEYSELAKKYPLSKQSLRRAAYAFDEIIDIQSGKVTEERLENEIQRYKEKSNQYSDWNNSLKSAYDAEDETEFEKAREDLIEYFKQNPNGEATEAIAATEYNPTEQQVNGLYANLVKHGDIDPDNEDPPADDQENVNGDGFEITLQLTKKQARGVVLEGELPTDVKQKVTDQILESVGL